LPEYQIDKMNLLNRNISMLALSIAWAFTLYAVPVSVADQKPPRAEQPKVQSATLTMIVMDPLAGPLSCACVPGKGQRDYKQLAKYLEKQLGRPVAVIFEESLDLALPRAKGKMDIVIGKRSIVLYDAKHQKKKLHPLAMLTGPLGKTTLTGAFMVRGKDPAKKLTDLRGRTIVLAPQENAEANAAAIEALTKAGIKDHVKLKTCSSIDQGALMVADGEADVAVTSTYLLPTFEGCGKIGKGELRIIAETQPVPFVGVFAADTLDAPTRRKLIGALLGVKQNHELLKVMESKSGFVSIDQEKKKKIADTQWTDWRGPGRMGVSPFVPKSLPKKMPVIWSTKLTGPDVAGIAATDRYVVVPDKSADLKTDIYRCLDAVTGKQLWTVTNPAYSRKMDYTSAPRATPVIHQGLVYLHGALGHLHCVELKTGKTIWSRNLVAEYEAEVLNWGSSAAPLIVDDLLITNPGAKNASVVGLDLKTGKVRWKTPGSAAAYGAFMLGTFGGVRQVIGYDVRSLGGWDPKTGKRLWEMNPGDAVDFNVGTPVPIGGRFLVATENNATRLYDFTADGKAITKPVAFNDDLAPDSCTPVMIGHRIFCSAYGELYCLDARNGLKTIWSVEDDLFQEHVNLIAGNSRVLAWTIGGDLLLIDGQSDSYKLISHIRPIAGKVETLSHPAILKNRLFLRGNKQLVCFKIE
jgi:outer membrane protein assembly factor BamB